MEKPKKEKANTAFRFKTCVDTDKVYEKLVDGIDKARKVRLYNSLYDNSFWEGVKDLRKDYEVTTGGWSKSRTRRHIASVPVELYYRAKKLYGADVFSNRKKFKKLFLKDDVGQWTLLVPKNSI